MQPNAHNFLFNYYYYYLHTCAVQNIRCSSAFELYSVLCSNLTLVKRAFLPDDRSYKLKQVLFFLSLYDFGNKYNLQLGIEAFFV